MAGYIKLHRQLKDWGWYTEPNTFRLFIHLLLSANHKEAHHKGQIIKAGEIKTGRKKLASETGLSEMQIRTALKNLKNTEEITIKTHTKYSIISITKWNEYQLDNQQDNQQVTNKQPTSNQQVTTNKNEKNNKNVKKDIKDNGDLEQAVKLYNLLAEKIERPSVQKLTETRKKKLKARLDDCGGLDGWKYALQKIEESNFLRKGSGSWGGVNFDFMMQESSFVKIMEGAYDNRTAAQSKSETADIFDKLRKEM